MIVREYASIVYELTRRVRQGNGQRLRQTHRAADGQPRHRAVGALHADLERAARLADADLRNAVGKVRREHDGRGDAAGGAARLRDARAGLTHEHDRLHAAGRPVEKQRADGARLRRGGNGTLHERIVRLRAIHDKVRDAVECHAHGLHVRPIGRLHRARQRHHRGRLPRRCVRHDRLNAFRPADLGKNAGFPLRAGAQRVIKPRAAQGVAAKFTAHHLQPDLPAAARRGQKSGLFNAQLRQAQQLCRDARALRGQHVREHDGRDVARRIEHRDFIFPFHFSGLHGGHSVKWTWLLM